jgi:hypothetical protein
VRPPCHSDPWADAPAVVELTPGPAEAPSLPPQARHRSEPPSPLSVHDMPGIEQDAVHEGPGKSQSDEVGSTLQEDPERRGSARGQTGPLVAQGGSAPPRLRGAGLALGWPPFPGSVALAMVALRPLAGAHSWADTGTGLLIGSAFGLLVSHRHIHTASPTSPAVSVSASPVQISLAAAF